MERENAVKRSDHLDDGFGLAAFHLVQTLLWLTVRHRLLPRAAAIDAVAILPKSIRERYADGSVSPDRVEAAVSHIEALRAVLETAGRPAPSDPDEEGEKSA